jgi:hypothetical protein
VFEVVEFTNKLGTVVDSCSCFLKESGGKFALSVYGWKGKGFKEAVPLFIAPKRLGLGFTSFLIIFKSFSIAQKAA